MAEDQLDTGSPRLACRGQPATSISVSQSTSSFVPKAINDVETLKQRLRAEAHRASLPDAGIEVHPARVPDAASGIVAVLKRLFNVSVRIVGVRGAREWLGFDGHYSGRNTVLVNSE